MAIDEGSSTEARIRGLLAREGAVREVRMFGGMAFMVSDRMVVALDRVGDLIVRIDPAWNEELLAQPGAKRAEMGKGRAMGPNWIAVRAEALDDEALSFWLDVALRHHRSAGA